jgi:hypothetical protein
MTGPEAAWAAWSGPAEGACPWLIDEPRPGSRLTPDPVLAIEVAAGVSGRSTGGL